MTSFLPASTPPSTTDERRQHLRIAFQAPAQLVLASGRIDVAVLDISLKGALVRLPANAAIEDGATCKLYIQLDKMDEQIGMEAQITHAEDGNAGLLCLIIDIDSVTHLRRLVELNLGDPALLERELSTLVAD
jgi:hypothetical protein